jgi:predicted lactoylglutathione lyase
VSSSRSCDTGTDVFGLGETRRDPALDGHAFVPLDELHLRDATSAIIAGMEQRLSLITLGVEDLPRARRFYEALGWTTRAEPDDDVVFFQAGTIVIALWSRAQLAEDTVVPDSRGWGGITLAHNVRSPSEVDTVLAEAERAGARITRPGAKTFWGGYSGVFVDPDGHAWEVAHNPRWTLGDDGSIRLPP